MVLNSKNRKRLCVSKVFHNAGWLIKKLKVHWIQVHTMPTLHLHNFYIPLGKCNGTGVTDVGNRDGIIRGLTYRFFNRSMTIGFPPFGRMLREDILLYTINETALVFDKTVKGSCQFIHLICSKDC